MTSIDEIARGLDKVKWNGDRKFTACCPAHNDRTPSFSVTDVDGKVLFHCFGGCSQNEVLNALRGRGLWHDRPANGSRQRSTVSEAQIRHHQIVVALALGQREQGLPVAADDLAALERSVQFLEGAGFGGL